MLWSANIYAIIKVRTTETPKLIKIILDASLSALEYLFCWGIAACFPLKDTFGWAPEISSDKPGLESPDNGFTSATFFRTDLKAFLLHWENVVSVVDTWEAIMKFLELHPTSPSCLAPTLWPTSWAKIRIAVLRLVSWSKVMKPVLYLELHKVPT